MARVASIANPGQCRVIDCEVTLVVRENGEQTRMLACKHKLADLSDYFNTMLYGNFKEKNQKEVTIEGVTKSELVLFVEWASKHPKPLQVKDADSLCGLIVVADRFLCASLEEQILAVLAKETMFEPEEARQRSVKREPESDEDETDGEDYFLRAPEEEEELDDFTVPGAGVADWKLKLLQVAEKHKGTGASVLESCIRRCGDLEIDQVAALHGKVSEGTLAAVYATIGRAKDATISKGRANAAALKPTPRGEFKKRIKNLLEPVTFSEIKRIRIDKNLFSS